MPDSERGSDIRRVVGGAGADIAVVGMSCRLPRADGPAAFWDLVRSGSSAISPVPEGRWDASALSTSDRDEAGKSVTFAGGYLDQVDRFDAAFFGISPREAAMMDPQQRLVLELGWEALEDHRVPPEALRGAAVGVFVGSIWTDYADLLYRDGPRGVTRHTLTGMHRSIIANRLSYTLGLRGPSMTVDSAQSSSLVSVHMACESIRRGESVLALAGGVNLNLGPVSAVGASQFGGLSPDGRCYTFDARANGYVRGEGGALVVLKSLDAATADGDRIYCTVPGSAINNDGGGAGLTAPSREAQTAVLGEAYRMAGTDPAQVQYVELHGTGTPLGDPIEAAALGAVLGTAPGRAEPLQVGSAKTNVGHLEGAAGIVGMVKTVLSLWHRELPPSLNFDRPNPEIPLDALGMRVRTGTGAWPGRDRLLQAGVSAFGMGGTNCHVVLRESPPVEPAAGVGGPATDRPDAPVVMVLSGRTPEALAGQAGRLREWMEAAPPADLRDVALSLASTRSRFARGAAVVGRGQEEILDGLRSVELGGPAVLDVPDGARPASGLAFLFAGQGTQHPEMGRDLHRSFPAFARALDRVCDELDGHLERPLRDVMFAPAGSAGAALLGRTGYTQPALFAFEVALFGLFESWGVRPDHIAGHSIGEIAAAHVAGVLSLPDAATLVAARGRLMEELPAGGAMLAVRAPEERVRALLEERPGRVALAAVNGPGSLVVAGDAVAITEIGDELEPGHRVRRLRVSHAFHSPLMDPMTERFRRVAEGLDYHLPQIPIVSTLTGEPAGPELCTPDHWVRHARETVRFSDAVGWLAGAGTDRFLEIGPDATLTGMAALCLESDPAAVSLAAQGTERGESAGASEALTALTALAALHLHGVEVQWPHVLPGARPVDLPTYAFQRERHWLPPAEAPEPPPVTGAADAAFWQAVERADHSAVAGELDLDEAGTLVPEMVAALSSWRRRRQHESVVDGRCLVLEWRPVRYPAVDRLDGHWLVLAPVDRPAGGAVASTVATVLARAARCTVLDVEVGGLEPGRLAGRLAEFAADRDVRGVVSLLTMDRAPDASGPAAAAALVPALERAELDAPLWCLTGGAVSTGPEDPPRNPEQAAAWGYGRIASVQAPHRWAGLVDLPGCLDEATTARLCAVLGSPPSGEQIALRGDRTVVARLVPAGPRPVGPAYRTGGGTVLIVGGGDTLSTRLAVRLAEGGAGHVVLAGPDGPDGPDGPVAPSPGGLREQLAGLGTDLDVHTCDPADPDQLAAVVASLPGGRRPSLVVHVCEVRDGTAVAELDRDRLASALRRHVAPARSLARLTDGPDAPPLLLSCALDGVPGGRTGPVQSAVAAQIGELARTLRSAGRRSSAVAWGAHPGGRAAGSAEASAELAVAALLRVLECDEAVLTVTDADDNPAVPMRSGEPSRPVRGTASDALPGCEGDALSPVRRDRELVELVRAEVAVALGHGAAESVVPTMTFRELGLDSLTGVELCTRIGERLGRPLPRTLAFDFPTPVLLAEHLRRDGDGDGEPVTGHGTDGPGDPDEPIAIVGMSCRLPGGVSSPEEFWQLLAAGGDATSEFPADRGWDLAALADPDGLRTGTSSTGRGGFLHDATGFDAGFFGISPREARAMDPQQRVLLEESWAALENAGIPPDSLRATRTGVYVGATPHDYGSPLDEGGAGQEGFLLTGNTPSVLSGRIAYSLGLEGPAVTVDTACSSSLVAVHLAVQALRRGESSTALACGVAVMSRPGMFVAFSQQGGLAPDGRCKPFAAAADGTAWSEGAAVLVLERLSEARRRGREVLAVVRGSAVNQDGASNGLTAPNGTSQRRVITEALRSAGLRGGDVDVVEAHGTGTRLGDPIEAQALAATYGRERPADSPLWLGSVKSNIGHTQAAAGVVGMVKMVLALRAGRLPRTLHVDEPSPYLDWAGSGVRLLTEPVVRSASEPVARAGVSSFGISGTNAHVLLEQAPPEPEPEQPSPGDTADVPPVAAPEHCPWVIGAHSRNGLHAQAARLRTFLSGRNDAASDVGLSLAAGRSALEHRAVVLGDDPDRGFPALNALARGDADPSVVAGVASAGPNPVFVFPGQGAQWVGMGVELAGSSSVFAARLGECAAALSEWVGWDVWGVLGSGVGEEVLWGRVDVVQPVSWAVMVSLAAVWRSCGVVPSAVVGHSQGEIAAACVAGVLSLRDGARVVALRSAAIAERLSGRGAMAAVPLPVDEVHAVLERCSGGVSVAAVNGPRSTVISGDPDSLDGLVESWVSTGVRAKRIAVDYASHSAQVEDLRERLAEDLAPITPAAGGIPLWSTVTGGWVDGTSMDAGYWYDNLRGTVRFGAAVDGLLDAGHDAFVEVSPHPVLVPAMQECVAAGPGEASVTGTLRRNSGGPGRLLTALAEAWVGGVGVRWETLFPGASRTALPSYAFQRSRYWLDGASTAGTAAQAATPDGPGDRFWAAVERGDLAELAGTLELPDAALEPVLPALDSWRRRAVEQATLDDWTYRIRWNPVSPLPARSPHRSLLVAVADEQDEWVRAVLDGLATAGVDPTTVVVPAGSGRAAVAARLGAQAGTGPDAVLSLLACGSPDGGLSSTVALVQALGDAGVRAPLWCATRDSVAVDGAAAPGRPDGALLWGFGRVAALEMPARWGGLVDLPEAPDRAAAARMAGILAGTEDQVAVRPAGVFARRLERVSGSVAGSAWRPRGTVLVTGGTGALGAQVARRLVAAGVEHLVLAGRRGPLAGGAGTLAEELRVPGIRVTVVACDVGDPDAVRRLVDDLASDGPPMTAVVHAAGALDDASVDALQPGQIERVLRVKVGGARNLHDATSHLELDAFVLFSSFGATVGLPGQANYAPGNAFLDAFAQWRRGRGLVATSVAWGAWDGGGMAEGAVRRTLERHGVPPMDPERALTALQLAVGSGAACVTVADVAWDRFHPTFTAARPSPLLSTVPDVAGPAGDSRADEVAVEPSGGLVARLAGLSQDDRVRSTLELVVTHTAAVLGHDPAAVGPARPFSALGFDSVTGVELRNRLVSDSGLALDTTLIYDRPTPRAVAEHLLDLVGDTARTGDTAAGLSLVERIELVRAGIAGAQPAGPAGHSHGEIAERLRGLLAEWDSSAAGRPGNGHPGPGPEVDTASDDELFSLIDRRLGGR